ncbi:hypothetical protein ABTP95_21270, partial [Acinetobacter baumannii]
ARAAFRAPAVCAAGGPGRVQRRSAVCAVHPEITLRGAGGWQGRVLLGHGPAELRVLAGVVHPGHRRGEPVS